LLHPSPTAQQQQQAAASSSNIMSLKEEFKKYNSFLPLSIANIFLWTVHCVGMYALNLAHTMRPCNAGYKQKEEI
jgi:hypothetical protein